MKNEETAMNQKPNENDASGQPALTGRALFLSVIPSGKVELKALSAEEAGDPEVIKRILYDTADGMIQDYDQISDVISMLLFRLASTELKLGAALANAEDNPL